MPLSRVYNTSKKSEINKTPYLFTWSLLKRQKKIPPPHHHKQMRKFIQEKHELATFRKLAPDGKCETALEIGCGKGTRLIKKYYQYEKITAIDLDEKMIEIAKRIIRSFH